jgi:hypothetical protein
VCVIASDGIEKAYDARLAARCLPRLLPSWMAERHATDPLQREQIRSPKPSLQKIDMHFKQVRLAATSAAALIALRSLLRYFFDVISCPPNFIVFPCLQER